MSSCNKNFKAEASSTIFKKNHIFQLIFLALIDFLTLTIDQCYHHEQLKMFSVIFYGEISMPKKCNKLGKKFLFVF